MEKRIRYGKTVKDQWRASTQDRLYRFLLAEGAVRGVVLHGTRMVNEMRANHELGILETLVLGRAYLGAGLMSADLKSRDRIVLTIDCSGPIRGLVVEASAFGEVRGYLKQVPIALEAPMQDTDLSKFFGAGILSVTRHQQDAKHPFTGQVALQYGNIAQDLAYYYLESEQVPTAFRLGIDFDRKGEVAGAGGLLLQAMPGAQDRVVADLERRIQEFPPLGVAFRHQKDPQPLVKKHFREHRPEFTDSRHIEFMCHCNRTRLRNLITLLPIDELEDILEKGPFPLELRCHYCNTRYRFSERSIRAIYGKRYPRG